MSSSWEQIDIFPIIVRIISSHFQSTGEYATHDEIVEDLLVDSEAATIIAGAKDESQEPHSAEWLAHNMVAWFSQRITVGQSEWGSQLERKKMNGKWAYRPGTDSGQSCQE